MRRISVRSSDLSNCLADQSRFHGRMCPELLVRQQSAIAARYCTQSDYFAANAEYSEPVRTSELDQFKVSNTRISTTEAETFLIRRSPNTIQESNESPSSIRTVAHKRNSRGSVDYGGTLVLDGREYRPKLIGERPVGPNVIVASETVGGGDKVLEDRRLRTMPQVEPTLDVVNMNLPAALSMVGGQHPAVGLAQWRVQEAYAQLDQAEMLWLPSLQAGMGFNRHDGNLFANIWATADPN
ncbi:hypothetical protein AB1L42_17795 [Thalassoglobus sp. JC818]|uniref:hypothetical protein n=1 Tax=Thalassoglobus sp. JC818 TaxID=3232136 RepID=UPI003457D3B3